jgi:hypothetical protein
MIIVQQNGKNGIEGHMCIKKAVQKWSAVLGHMGYKVSIVLSEYDANEDRDKRD